MAEVTLEQIAQMMIERKARDIAFYEELASSIERIALAQAELAQAQAEAAKLARVQARVQAVQARVQDLASARIEVELAIIRRNTVAIMAEDVSESSYAYRAR